MLNFNAVVYRSSHSTEAANQEDIKKVNKIVLADLKTKMREIAETVKI